MASSIPPLADALTPQSVEKAYGPILIGTFLGLVLYGIVLNQVYRYGRTYSSDRVELKVAVYLTVILETAHMALSCYMCYYYLVLDYFKPNALLYSTHPGEFLPTLTGLIIGTSHAFFARRAYLFGGRYKVLLLPAVAFLATGIAFSIATTIVEYHGSPKGLRGGFKGPEQWLILCALGPALCADTILTTILIIALRQNRSGVKRMDSVMDVLVLYTLTTGLITSISIFTLLLVVAIAPSMAGLHTGISVIVTQLFANTFLAALNSRQSLNKRIARGAMGTEIFGTDLREHERAHAHVTLEVPIAWQTGMHSLNERNLADFDAQIGALKRTPEEETKELEERWNVLHIW